MPTSSPPPFFVCVCVFIIKEIFNSLDCLYSLFFPIYFTYIYTMAMLQREKKPVSCSASVTVIPPITPHYACHVY